MRRLLQLRGHLLAAFTHEDYLAYKTTAFGNQDQLEKANKMEKMVLDPSVQFFFKLRAYLSFAIPAYVALREMDRSDVRSADVPTIWDTLEAKYARLNPTGLITEPSKTATIALLEKRRKSYHRDVFDAAWILNPSNTQLVRAANADPIHEMNNVVEKRLTATKTVLKITLRRKLRSLIRMPKEKEWKQSQNERAESSIKRVQLDERRTEYFYYDAEKSEIDEEFNKAWPDLSSNLNHYIRGSGPYEDNALNSMEDWQTLSCGLLKYLALRILHMSCTISNVERSHKVYSRIHTATRNRLNDDRVDDLTMSRIVHRLNQLSGLDGSGIKRESSRVDVSAIAKCKEEYSDDSDSLLLDLEDFGEREIEVLVRTNHSILSPENGTSNCKFEIDGDTEDAI